MPVASPLLSALVLAACSVEPPPSGKDMVVVAGKGQEKALDAQGKEQPVEHAVNTVDFDRFAFPCCTTPAATALVGAYVDLAERLAADDEAGAGTAVGALATAAEAAAKDAGLSEAGRAQATAIATTASGLASAPIASVREPLDTLSVAVISFARDHRGGEGQLVSAYCPMAPGHWLQRAGDIRNPYYGADMLTCGTLEDVAEVE